MPINYLRQLTSPTRSELSNRHLGCSLAFVAGAVNAGGFLAVGQYTSHMSGIVSALADNLVLGQAMLLVTGATSLLAFLLGAATAAIMINWGRQRHWHSEYAMPLLLEAGLLLAFGILGSQLQGQHLHFVTATVALLCFVMGLQNALVTKISRAEIRTTHVTGLVTDIGIELGRMCYWRVASRHDSVLAPSPRRFFLLGLLLLMFFTGGVIGAVGFSAIGFMATIPLATSLLVLALVPVWDDLVHHPN
ncbi:YoaK family protein [Herbaspirillum sp. alder98]|uniref:YoaK family protein n=1 Tax=Herbaspirillum sp. alder98 TaxID=2913096 RepID=UPI001CD87E7A|nr:YoaK family protein [Herbaspirillum sp. alder98]MCA1323636.1 DUF1275 domain-containing protein [Herbaspirillum sp. alder98]